MQVVKDGQARAPGGGDRRKRFVSRRLSLLPFIDKKRVAMPRGTAAETQTVARDRDSVTRDVTRPAARGASLGLPGSGLPPGLSSDSDSDHARARGQCCGPVALRPRASGTQAGPPGGDNSFRALSAAFKLR